MTTCRWHITSTAARQYAEIAGLPLLDAASELGRLATEARMVRDVGPGQVDQIWRVSVTLRGRRTRLELIVSRSDAHEWPQLIYVRRKDDTRTRNLRRRER